MRLLQIRTNIYLPLIPESLELMEWTESLWLVSGKLTEIKGRRRFNMGGYVGCNEKVKDVQTHE
jgi:hypothetical protein